MAASARDEDRFGTAAQVLFFVHVGGGSHNHASQAPRPPSHSRIKTQACQVADPFVHLTNRAVQKRSMPQPHWQPMGACL